MKLVRTLLLMLSLSGCGEPTGCTDNLTGTWKNDQDTLTLNATGVCSGKSSYCESEFEFSNAKENNGSINIQVESTGSKTNCPDTGPHDCYFNINEKKMGRVIDGTAKVVNVTYLSVTCDNNGKEFEYEKVN